MKSPGGPRLERPRRQREQIIRGSGLYWYGRALLDMGYLVVAPDIGQHELQHTNWSLMGERTWDAFALARLRPLTARGRPGTCRVAGLSLGGETTMYVAALDERVKQACSSGWLTTVATCIKWPLSLLQFLRGLKNSIRDIFRLVGSPWAIVRSP